MFEDFEDYGGDGGEGGGMLAAQLSPQQRMDMIQKGYNPLSPTDVERYVNRQKPADGLMEVAGVNQYKNLGGGGGIDPKDKGLITTDLEGFDDFQVNTPQVNPRDAMASKMNNYGAGFGNKDVNDMLATRLNRNVRETAAPKKGPIALPKQVQPQKKVITEAKQAKTVGYKLGVNYLNAFIEVLQAPSIERRTKLIEQMNNLVIAEDRVHPNLLQEYRNGISYAEKELFNKLKKKNG